MARSLHKESNKRYKGSKFVIDPDRATKVLACQEVTLDNINTKLLPLCGHMHLPWWSVH